MEKLRSIGLFRQILLAVLLLMLVVFSVLYPITAVQKGFAYQNTLLVPRETEDGLVYEGRLWGQRAAFTVTADSVTFRLGDRIWGPYTILEDPAAVPGGMEARGVEVRRGEELLFRGGAREMGGEVWLYNEENAVLPANITMTVAGEEADLEPSVFTILTLWLGPELTHRGSGAMWLVSALLTVVTAVDVLYAEELFRWRMSFRIRDAETAEPSDWELAGRHISWTVMTVMALAFFLVGLRAVI